MTFNFNKLIEKPKNNNTLIVDALNLAFRWKHQAKLNFIEDYVQTVLSFANSYNCSNIIITADQGSSKEFFVEYERCLNVLSKLHPVIRFDETEADDLAAYIVKKKEAFNLGDIVLISSDRDWDLLIQDGVMRFSYVTRKEVTMENWGEHYDVPREQYACFKCLTGDKGDNVPGYAGIGPKRAAILLQEYESAYNIYDSVPIEGKFKYLQEINNNPDRILRNYELMDLLTYCEDAIGSKNCSEIDRRLS